MDIATLLGLVGGTGVVVAAILVGSDMYIFLNLPGFLIVMGGTFAATLIKFPLKQVSIAFKVGVHAAFVGDKEDPLELVALALKLAKKSRKGGLLALEGYDIANDFMKKGIQLCIDGMAPEVVRKTMTGEMNQSIRRHEEGSKIFRGIGDTAPAFGMIGTLVGLVQMLSSLSDPAAIGPAMAVAMLTTLYGAIIANLIALPIADKLESRLDSELTSKSLMIDSVLEIQAQTHPNVIEELLQVYLPEDQRTMISSDEDGDE
ncbi:MAG: flagellar motor protein PomA [Rhodospirillaceae bacterium]|jgi:chemotaxis protein MotA|nr:flagellar motor protein PomA [Rhodospirillaceae bacterium]MBT4219645.1 flagellar motor protein PomA [Rhodospirillaceae bacterium]MBT4463566.1 flagellar motor protein PomA [Rhodospirillaceae bacterium]MBT5014598.1 flagellar motor protein PomA [Rhodospirillaceae bacterium]MBT5309109.1 flagellar motor protein PomA [Rhodospirillaceae bacterium]